MTDQRRVQVIGLVIVAVLVVGIIGLITAGGKKTVTTTARRSSTTTTVASVTAPSTVTPPTAASTTTTTLPPITTTPHITVTITGVNTTSANNVTYDVNSRQTQHTVVALPATFDLGPPNQFGDIVDAQNASQAADTSITCTIRYHDGTTAPVTDTAAGRFAIAECIAKGTGNAS